MTLINEEWWKKIKESINVECGFFFVDFSKSVSMGPTFIREMRVCIFEKKREISQ